MPRAWACCGGRQPSLAGGPTGALSGALAGGWVPGGGLAGSEWAWAACGGGVLPCVVLLRVESCNVAAESWLLAGPGWGARDPFRCREEQAPDALSVSAKGRKLPSGLWLCPELWSSRMQNTTLLSWLAWLSSASLKSRATTQGGLPKAPQPNAERTRAWHPLRCAASRMSSICICMASSSCHLAY